MDRVSYRGWKGGNAAPFNRWSRLGYVFIRNQQRTKFRRGAATLDFVLGLGVVLPLVAFILYVGPRIMNLVYEMTSVLISWPFMTII